MSKTFFFKETIWNIQSINVTDSLKFFLSLKMTSYVPRCGAYKTMLNHDSKDLSINCPNSVWSYVFCRIALRNSGMVSVVHKLMLISWNTVENSGLLLLLFIFLPVLGVSFGELLNVSTFCITLFLIFMKKCKYCESNFHLNVEALLFNKAYRRNAPSRLVRIWLETNSTFPS